MVLTRSLYRPLAFLFGFLLGLFASIDSPPPSPQPMGGTQPKASTTDFATPANSQITADRKNEAKVCNDPMVKPIWNALRRNKEVREALDDEISPTDCRDAFEIDYFDLNRDGKKEIFARAVGIPFCGAVGNCDLFVLQKTKKGLTLLLHANDYIDATAMGEQLLTKRTNGYLDILTLGHFSASETSYTTYKFNGRKYVEISCKYEIATYDRDNKLALESISCKEFYRRLDRDLKQSDQVVNLR